MEAVIEKLNVEANELRPLCTKNHLAVHNGISEVMIKVFTYQDSRGDIFENCG